MVHEGDGRILASLLAMAAGLGVAEALVPDGQGDLFSERLKQSGHLLSKIVAEVDGVHPGTDKVPRIKHSSCFFNDAYGGLS
jgi:hypothetical protein